MSKISNTQATDKTHSEPTAAPTQRGVTLHRLPNAKPVSGINALRHEPTGQTLFFTTSELRDYLSTADLIEELRPVTTRQHALALGILNAEWRLKRLMARTNPTARLNREEGRLRQFIQEMREEYRRIRHCAPPENPRSKVYRIDLVRRRNPNAM